MIDIKKYTNKNKIKMIAFFKKKKWLRDTICFAITFGIFLTLDLLTKHFWFKYAGDQVTGPIQHDFKIFGVRSNAHVTTTFADRFGWNVTNQGMQIISIILVILLSTLLISQTKKRFIIAFSILLAGVVGNTVDRLIANYVRNVLFIPWRDNGTFNFADIFIVIGASLIGINTLHSLLKSFKENKNEKR